MAEKIFAEGFIVKHPHEKSPSFVKGSVSIKVSEAIAFLTKHQERDWVNLDLLESRDGAKLYLALNTFKPQTSQPTQNTTEPEEADAEETPF